MQTMEQAPVTSPLGTLGLHSDDLRLAKQIGGAFRSACSVKRRVGPSSGARLRPCAVGATHLAMSVN